MAAGQEGGLDPSSVIILVVTLAEIRRNLDRDMHAAVTQQVVLLPSLSLAAMVQQVVVCGVAAVAGGPRAPLLRCSGPVCGSSCTLARVHLHVCERGRGGVRGEGRVQGRNEAA